MISRFFFLLSVSLFAVCPPRTLAGAGPEKVPGRPNLSAAERKDADFLDMVEKQSFQYFVGCSNPANGLVLDKASNSGSPDFKYAPASIAAVGFGLAALVAGAERGWISKEAAAERVKTTLKFFSEKMESEHGFFYHFVAMDTGKRVWNCEISSIDTALFLAGALTAAQYFESPEIKDLAQKLYKRVDWKWMANGSPFLAMGWTPEKQFLTAAWNEYNESMVMYILALGSPTFPLTPESWSAIRRTWGRYKGHELILSPPLFTHQFSHAFIDFRGKRDAFADYFENSVQATLANRQFCIDSAGSFKTYGKDSWGLTASIGPDGYKAYGAPPGPALHDGTVAPSAAASSIVFTPEYSLSAMKYWYSRYRAGLWGNYGFSDSFNLDRNYFAADAFGINQGPTVLMLENYRSGLIWKLFMSRPEVQKGMKAAGFGDGAGRPVPSGPIAETAVYFLHKRPLVKVEMAPYLLDFPGPGLSSPAWKNSGKRIILGRKFLQAGDNRQPGYKVTASLLAKSRHLLVKLEVRDNEIVSSHPDAAMYEDDCVELYIDSLNDGFKWGGADDYQLILSPGPGGSFRAREFFHADKRPSAFWLVDSSMTAGGYEAVLALDRVLNSDAKFNWFFLAPATYLGEIQVKGG